MWICQVPPVVVPESPAPTVLDPDNHGKLKKEKKEKKDKSTKKSKKDKKAKKEKKRRKEQQRTAQTQTDEEDSEFDSEWAEAKRQRCQSATPVSERYTPDEAASDPPSDAAEPAIDGSTNNNEDKETEIKEETQDMDKDDDMNAEMTDDMDKGKKQRENQKALAALQRASTADLAEDLREKLEPSGSKTSGSETGSTTDPSDAGSVELTDQQRIARHNHLNRYYRSLKGLGPNLLSTS